MFLKFENISLTCNVWCLGTGTLTEGSGAVDQQPSQEHKKSNHEETKQQSILNRHKCALQYTSTGLGGGRKTNSKNLWKPLETSSLAHLLFWTHKSESSTLQL